MHSVISWIESVYNNGIVQNLVASFIWVMIVASAVLIFNRNRHRRWWRLPMHKGSVIRIITGTWDIPRTTLGYTHAVTTVSDASTVGYAIASLTIAYGKRYLFRTDCSRWFHESFWDDCVVLAGGRVRNSATNDLLRQLDETWNVPFEIEDVGVDVRTITDLTNGTKYASVFEDNEIVRDFGVIARLPNPYKLTSSVPVIMFYGLHTFGTVGAAKMVSPEYSKYFAKSFPRRAGKWWEVLVSVSVRNEETYPEFIAFRKVGRRRAKKVSLQGK